MMGSQITPPLRLGQVFEISFPTFTPDEMLKRNIERTIDLQLSGHAPYAGSKTWRDYWREFYRVQHPPEGAVEFKSREQIEAYTKQRLRARGLPTDE